VAKGNVLRCTQCGHRQRPGDARKVERIGFRQEGDVWVVLLKGGERHAFKSREAAWAWLDQRERFM
jgi:hypothetical protein